MDIWVFVVVVVFQFAAIVTKTARNICVEIFAQTCVLISLQ